MARKKYLDENNEEQQKGQQLQAKHQAVKLLQNHNQQQPNVGGGFLLGGGTKNRNKSLEYHHHSKNLDDSYASVAKQLSSLGLNIREMPGDGNCLFRALSDQITGSSRNHLEYRRAVVQYMKEYRGDFEPFVEDDEPFDKYIHRLSQAGTFAGNDVIVAFARLHNVSVVIHQLNSPAWIIHPSKDTTDHSTGREVHIFYHNGDHYNSVRRIGDDSESPTNIKLHSQATSNKPSGKKSPPHSSCRGIKSSSTSTGQSYTSSEYCGRDEDYWVKDSSDLNRLVEEVMQQTNYPDPNFVRDTLLDYNFDMVSTIDFILSISCVMNQQHCLQRSDTTPKTSADDGDKFRLSLSSDSQQPVGPVNLESDVEHKELNNLVAVNKMVTDMDEQCEDVEESSEDSGMPDDSDENSIAPSPSEVVSSQDKEISASSRKEPRQNNKQKKVQKKRERKREAELRKKKSVIGNEIDRENSENVVVISNLGSLDI